MIAMSHAIITALVVTAVVIEVADGFVPVHERPQRVERNPPPRTPPHHRDFEEPPPPPQLSRGVHNRGAITHPEPPPGPMHSSMIGSSRMRTPFFIPSMLAGVFKRLGDVEVDVDDLNRNFENANGRISSVVGQMTSMQSQLRRLQQPDPVAAALRFADSELEDRVSRLESENEELRTFLVTFEIFFKRLMSASPADFDPNAAPEERLSRLHQYLGNAEAELMTMNPRGTIPRGSDSDPAPPLSPAHDTPLHRPGVPGAPHGASPSGNGTATDEQHEIFLFAHTSDLAGDQISTASKGENTGKKRPTTVDGVISVNSAPQTDNQQTQSATSIHLSATDADLLVAAMERLSAQNGELTARLQTLEKKASDANQPLSDSGDGVSTQVTNNVVTTELLNKVDRLEQVVALQASSILENVEPRPRVEVGQDATPAGRGPSGDVGSFGISGGVGSFGISSAGTASRKRPPPTTMNEEDVEIMKEMLEETRDKRSGSRKSAFSVARTRPMLGSSEAQRVDFDHVYVNKGRDFSIRNSTFACERAGFYFINFNLRSYDDHFLGVALMKNNDVMTAVYTDADSRNVMESQSLIVHLEPGDELSLRLGPSERFGIHSDIYKYVTFSGFLVYSGY